MVWKFNPCTSSSAFSLFNVSVLFRLLLKMEAFCNANEGEINFDSFIQFSVFLFRLFFFDFQPLKIDASRVGKFVYYAKIVYFIFSVITLGLGIVSLLAYMVYNLDDFANASSCIPNAVSILLIGLRVSIMFSRKRALREVFQDLSDLFAHRAVENKHHKVKNYLEGYNRQMKMYTAPVVIVLIPIIMAIVPYILFGTMKLPINYWFPFDAFQLKTFPFAWIWVNWIAWHIMVFLLATDSLLYGLITVIVMEFDFLKTDLSNVRLMEQHERKEMFGKLITRHNKLLVIYDKLQEIYTLIFTTSFVITSMVLCFVVFQISIAKTDVEVYWFYVSFLNIAGIQIWLLCFHGQKLIDSSESLAEGIYNSGWESIGDLAFKKQFVLIILRAQNATRLTAMGFADISLESFASVSDSFDFLIELF